MSTDNVEIKVALRNTFSESAKLVTYSIDEIKRKAAEADVAVDELGHSLNKTGNKALEAGVKAKIGAKGLKSAGKEASDTGVKFNALDKILMKLTGKGGGKNGGGSGSLWGLISWGQAFRGLKIPIIVGLVSQAVGVLATALNGLGAASYAGISGLAPLSGLLVAYPGFLGAFAQGMGVAKLATSGLSKAITTLLTPNANPADLAIAMSHLSPAGRKFAYSVVGMRQQLKKLTFDLQSQVLPHVTKLVDLFKGKYFDIFAKGLKQTATAMTGVIDKFHQYLALSKTQSKIAGIMKTNATVFGHLGGAAVNAFGALVGVLTAASPMLIAMSTSIEKFFATTNKNAENNKNSLTKFFDHSFEVAKKVYNFTSNLFNGLYALGRASKSLSSAMGGSFTSMAEKFNKWANSAKGQNSLKQYFKDMKPVVYALGHLFTSLIKSIGDIGKDPSFTKTINTISNQLLPALVNLIKSANTSGFLEGISSFITSIAKFASDTHMFGMIGNLLKVIGKVISAIGTIVKVLPKPIKDTIGAISGIFLLLLWKSEKFRGLMLKTSRELIKSASKKIWASIGWKSGDISIMKGAIKSLGTWAKANAGTFGLIGLAIAGALADLYLIKKIIDGFRAMHSQTTLPKGQRVWDAKSKAKYDSLLKTLPLVNGKPDKAGALKIIDADTMKSNTVTADIFKVKTLLDDKGNPFGMTTPSSSLIPSFSGTTIIDGKKFAGGDVKGGGNYLVGELGVEGFLSKTGRLSLIGQSGAEVRKFNESGTVIPNHLLSDFSEANSRNSMMFASALSGRNTPQPKQKSGNDNIPLQGISIGTLEVHQAQSFDVIHTIRRAIQIEERNRRERS